LSLQFDAVGRRSHFAVRDRLSCTPSGPAPIRRGFARLVRARSLVMFHHDPNHADEALEVLLHRARGLWGSEDDPPLLAYEGMELELGR
jgi:hypothetical protein